VNRSAGRRQAPVRGELTAELVEVLRAAPELVAYGAEDEALARVRSADRELAWLGRREALAAGLAEALSIVVTGLTAVGVLAVAVASHDANDLDRVLVATLALLTLASFDAVSRCPSPRESSRVPWPPAGAFGSSPTGSLPFAILRLPPRPRCFPPWSPWKQ